jgi:hypothetical protein
MEMETRTKVSLWFRFGFSPDVRGDVNAGQPPPPFHGTLAGSAGASLFARVASYRSGMFQRYENEVGIGRET